MAKPKIKPRTLPGFQDFLPARASGRQRMLDTIRRVYEFHGFAPLDTPAMEYEEVLTGQLESDKEIFRLRDQDDRHVALRFDLTVPLARVVAEHGQHIPRPFRRYHMAKVWREDKPKPGRFREFMQCDVDIVGVPSVQADIEILTVMLATLTGLGLERFQVRINHRQLLSAMIEKAGVDADLTDDILRTLDKIERLGWDTVVKLLSNPPSQKLEGIDAVPLGLSSESVAVLKAFVEIDGDPAAVLAALRDFFGDFAPAQRGLDDLQAIHDSLVGQGTEADQWRFDLSIARGLAYYTGPIFETALLDLPGIGSICSGGRYDGLVGRYAGQPVAATGTSIGIDRAYAALEKLGLTDERAAVAKVLVMALDFGLYDEYRAMAVELRAAGVPAEVYVGKKGLKAQMRYSDRQGFKVGLLVGGDELAAGEVTLKRLDLPMDHPDKQELVARDQLVARVKEVLDAS
jgi:histidyl-tRNA synthetase